MKGYATLEEFETMARNWRRLEEQRKPETFRKPEKPDWIEELEAYTIRPSDDTHATTIYWFNRGFDWAVRKMKEIA